MENDLFESATRTCGDLAVVFECDRYGGYFYLFDLTKEKGQEARAVIEVSDRGVSLEKSDVAVGWNASEDIGGLCIHGRLWAAFDQYGRRYGGSYGTQDAPGIPSDVISRFNSVADRGLANKGNIQAETR